MKFSRLNSFFRAGETLSENIWLKLWGAFKFYFLSGLFTLLPFVITIWVLYKIFEFADTSFLGPAITELLGIRIPGLGILITSFIIVIAGIVAERVGTGIYRFLENFLMKLPIAKWMITTTRQISDFLKGERRMLFKQVVLVEYPRKGIYSIGFEIIDAPVELTEKVGEELVSVFIPTTPNPTSGLLVFVLKKELRKVNISVEVAMKMIISGAIITNE